MGPIYEIVCEGFYITNHSRVHDLCIDNIDRLFFLSCEIVEPSYLLISFSFEKSLSWLSLKKSVKFA